MPYQAFKYPLGFLAGLSLAAAWLSPGTLLGAVFGWIACLFICLHIWIEERVYYSFLITGVISHLLAFHWLNATIADFGGLPQPIPMLAFLLFCLLSSAQFVLFVLFYRNLPVWTERLNLRAALAWSLCEILPIRIFPWLLGHTQLPIKSISFSASWGGSLIISFLMFWTAESLLKFILLRQRRKALLLGPICLTLAMLLNLILISLLEINSAKLLPLKTSIIQGNISIKEKGNIKFFEVNRERYEKLSADAIADNEEQLVVWPETAITEFLPIYNLSQRRILRTLQPQTGQVFLVGTLSAFDQNTYFNSAALSTSNFEPAQLYHKRILMPFGEFTPLAKTFPIFKQLNPQAGEFTAGTKADVLSAQMPSGITLKIAPLICYEDIISFPAQESVKLGANLLVNLTNDAWFGNTQAPRQHNLIAAFRAIENQRYLIRSTNSGLTAVIDPMGQTEQELPVFSEGILRANVKLLNTRTLYSIVGDAPWWVLSGLVLVMVVIAKSKKFVKKLKKLQSRGKSHV
jgi:apolipoprotein N-acyltransferase